MSPFHVTIPKMLINMKTQDQSIPYAASVTQTYFFMYFSCIDNLLLAVITYDRYVTIRRPLLYTIVMREELCLCLLVGSRLISCASALTHTLLLAQRSFCADNFIIHFWEFAALLKLSCSDTSLNELVIFTLWSVGFFFSIEWHPGHLWPQWLLHPEGPLY